MCNLINIKRENSSNEEGKLKGLYPTNKQNGRGLKMENRNRVYEKNHTYLRPTR